MAMPSIHRFVCKQYSYLACTLVCMQTVLLYHLYAGLYGVMSPVLWFVWGHVSCTLVCMGSCLLYSGLYGVMSPVRWFVWGHVSCTLVCMGSCLLYTGLCVSGMAISPVHWCICQ